MKRAVRLALLLVLALVAVASVTTFTAPTPAAQAAPDSIIWGDITEATIPSTGVRQIIPVTYRTLSADMSALRAELAKAPQELTEEGRNNPLVFEMPMPDGTFSRFAVVKYRMMEEGLSAQFPDWGTYLGQGIDDPTATLRLDITAQGFHGMIYGGKQGGVYIDPYQQGDTTNYISYFKSDFRNTRGEVAPDEVVVDDVAREFQESVATDTELAPTDGILRTYRLANAATGEYCATQGGTTASCQAAIVTAINRVNGVYEREVNLRMILIANNTDIVYLNGATDPYTNNDGFTMLTQNQNNLDSVIGAANYDIGHVFSTGGGGVAGLGVPCRAGQKARGVTGLPNPTGDPFYIDYVAHEMGHQWGSNHTFNGTTSNCGGGNRSAANANEPGSGISIMAYAGICGAEDIAEHSIDTFVSRSYDVIRNYIQNPASGDSCDVPIDTGNDAPVVDAGSDYNIPANTPFELDGSATDSTPNSLTYDWQQYTPPSPAPTGTNAGNTDDDLGNNPLFRPWLPQTDTVRIFPDLTYILNDNNEPPNPTDCPFIPGQPAPTGDCAPGETLPTTNRTLQMRLVVRDNQPNAGGVNYDTAVLTVTNTAGPFTVNTANSSGTTWTGVSTQNITWDVANTAAAPISCANVDIYVSTDGGETFGTPVTAATANDGSADIVVPNVDTTEGRVKVKCAGNVFFDINNANITITAIPTAVSLGALSIQPMTGMLPLFVAMGSLVLVAAGLVAFRRR